MSRTKRLTMGMPATGSMGFGVVSVWGLKREPRPAMGTIIFIFSTLFLCYQSPLFHDRNR